jgi:hypothetical protein
MLVVVAATGGGTLMIEESKEVQIARERLAMLRRRREEIVTDPDKPRRAKDMELAGVQGMMAQVEAEIQAYTAARMREQVRRLPPGRAGGCGTKRR